jgi:hypothetical protein
MDNQLIKVYIAKILELENLSFQETLVFGAFDENMLREAGIVHTYGECSSKFERLVTAT